MEASRTREGCDEANTSRDILGHFIRRTDSMREAGRAGQ